MPTTGLYKTAPKSTASFTFEIVIRLSKLEDSFDISAPTDNDRTSTDLNPTDHGSATLQLDSSFNIGAIICF